MAATDTVPAIKAVVFDAYGTLYDVQSVAAAIEAAFPGLGDYLTQVWRLKQLEYSWLRSMMGRYADFRDVTRESLVYALGTVGLAADDTRLDRLVDAYATLAPYPEAAETLAALGGYRLAILSNGSPGMLRALVSHSGLDRYFAAVISVDAKRVFKPDPRAYELVQETLGVLPHEVVFVTSNGFDVAGAGAFGFRVVRIERVTREAMQSEVQGGGAIGPAAMFRALRTQQECLGYQPDIVLGSLSELPQALTR